MSGATTYATFKETYETGKIIAGNHAKDLNRSLLFYVLAYTMQGLSYLSIYGVMSALFCPVFDAGHAWGWFGLMAVFVLINAVARWFAHDFDYGETTANVTHNMRANLGEKTSNHAP